MEKDNSELMKRLLARVEYIEKMETVQHPAHLKELINELMDKVDDIDSKLDALKNNSLF